MFKYFCFLFIFSYLPFSVSADKFTIALFSDEKINQLNLSLKQGHYRLSCESSRFRYSLYDVKDVIELKAQEKGVNLIINNKSQGVFSKIFLEPVNEDEGVLSLFSNRNEKKKREYQGSFTCYVDTLTKNLRLLNQVLFEVYIGGVVQSEIYARKDQLDVYKVQAIISRTWALKNRNKHLAEGYNTCDQVHCQVYKNRVTKDEVRQAVLVTCGEVIVDSSGSLIETPFHSNSGGQTVNSEDIWSSPISYLRSIVDTFSYGMRMAEWEKKVPKEVWLNYFSIFEKLNVSDETISSSLLNFTQSARLTTICNVPLRRVRENFGLRSTFFDVTVQADSVLLKGKGYGHGVGLSQEGAIRMVDLGFTYQQILSFYYTGALLTRWQCDGLALPKKLDSVEAPVLETNSIPQEDRRPSQIKVDEQKNPIPVKEIKKEKEKEQEEVSPPKNPSEQNKKKPSKSEGKSDFEFEIPLD